VHLSVCLSVPSHNSKRMQPNFAKFFMHAMHAIYDCYDLFVNAHKGKLKLNVKTKRKAQCSQTAVGGVKVHSYAALR